MTTQRLFVAIDLPDAVKAQLTHLRANLAGAKWVGRDQMHLTLRFIGDATELQKTKLEAGLAAIKAAPFSFHLEGVGQFPPKGKPRVLWVGLPPVDALYHLQAQVEQAAITCGFERADYPFSPHITLARFRIPPAATGETESYIRQHSGFKSDLINVDQFTLYASLLTQTGPLYTALAHLTLA